MNTTESGHVVKHPCHDNRLWLLRKQFECFAHVLVPPEVGFQVEDAKLWMVFSERCQEEMGDVVHEQRYVRRIGHRRLLHVHKILQPPILLGITEVTLDLKAKAVIINELFIALTLCHY